MCFHFAKCVKFTQTCLTLGLINVITEDRLLVVLLEHVRSFTCSSATPELASHATVDLLSCLCGFCCRLLHVDLGDMGLEPLLNAIMKCHNVEGLASLQHVMVTGSVQ